MSDNNKGQKDKFIATAREHGCDESEEAFEKSLKKLAKKGKKKKGDDACREPKT